MNRLIPIAVRVRVRVGHDESPDGRRGDADAYDDAVSGGSLDPIAILRSIVGRGRRGLLRCSETMVDARLSWEERRQTLGPAHLAWREHSAATNRETWNRWDWRQAGEEWTASPAWKQALVDDVLERWIAAGSTVLEIGPGAGRWTVELRRRAGRLILVDVSPRALDLCRALFAGATDVGYVLSDGGDLPGVADGSVGAVWSFDVFVHVAPVDQVAYLREIARVLEPGGVAVIHHADGRNRGARRSREGWRSPMSRGLFAALAGQAGLRIADQIDSWGPAGEHGLAVFGDAITICRRPGPAAAPR